MRGVGLGFFFFFPCLPAFPKSLASVSFSGAELGPSIPHPITISQKAERAKSCLSRRLCSPLTFHTLLQGLFQIHLETVVSVGVKAEVSSVLQGCTRPRQ